MKKCTLIIFVLGLLFPIIVSAKKANSYWYFLAKTENSVFDDGSIVVEYDIKDRGTIISSYPTLEIIIRNKTNESLYIDLSKCQILKNAQTVPLNHGQGGFISSSSTSALVGEKWDCDMYDVESDVNFSVKIIEITPKSTITLKNIMIFTASAMPYFNNCYYFWSPKKSNRYVAAYKMDELDSGDFINYEEADSPIKLGINLVYSFDKDCVETEKMSTMYYANKLVGSRFPMGFVGCPFVPDRELEIVSRIVPDWQTSDELIIKLRAYTK